MPTLDVYFYGKKIGTLTEKNSRLSFKYNEDADTPLSVNLPLQKEAFNDKLTRSFFNMLIRYSVSKVTCEAKNFLCFSIIVLISII